MGNGSRDVLISGCRGYDTQDDGIDVRGYRITVENCVTYNCTSNTDAHGIKAYGQDPYYGEDPNYYVRIVKCLSYNNYRGIFLSALGAWPVPGQARPDYRSKELEVINCTSANNTYDIGLENDWDVIYPIKAYIHNTITSSSTNRALLYIQNTIPLEPILTANYNLWWTQVPGLQPIDKSGTYYSSYLIEHPYAPGSWFLATGNDEHSRSVDPGFVDKANNNYKLQSSSVCIDAGTDVNLPYAGSAPDMGYFESGMVEVNCPASYLTTGENWISIPVAADNAQPYSVFKDLGYWPNCVYHNLYRYNSPTAGFAKYPTYQSDAVQFGKITPGGAYKLILGGNQPTIHVLGIELKGTQTLTIGGSGTRNFYFGNPFNKTIHKSYCKIKKDADEVSIEQAISNGWIGNVQHFNPTSKSWESIGNILEKWNAYRLTAYNTSGELNLVIYYPLPSDIDNDGDVDYDDLGIMGDNWLDDNCSSIPEGNLDSDCDVDFKDFAVLARNWLTGT
jgi:hypothetical protein